MTNRTNCAGCGGALIGTEISHGTCGHCGNRSNTRGGTWS